MYHQLIPDNQVQYRVYVASLSVQRISRSPLPSRYHLLCLCALPSYGRNSARSTAVTSRMYTNLITSM